MPLDDAEVNRRLRESIDCVARALDDPDRVVYGVNTGFGGMSSVPIKTTEKMVRLQENLIWFLKAGAGKPIPTSDVRAAMLLRANTFLHGASAVRPEIIERIQTFLNSGITPIVREFGSIGASGDLVPLASIAGALLGIGKGFPVSYKGEQIDALSALKELGLDPIQLQPKEGLALVNGTSVSTAIAANCLYDAQILFALALAAHALMIQSLSGMTECFDEYIHRLKPHAGQVWSARRMRELLAGSKLTCQVRSGAMERPEESVSMIKLLLRITNEDKDTRGLVGELRRLIASDDPQAKADDVVQKLKRLLVKIQSHREGSYEHWGMEPIQDRYSLRCLPQYLGPVKDGVSNIVRQIEVEMNSANDNPLVDAENDRIYHGGNFLGQYTAVGMDQLRYYVALVAKHLDAQIALLVEPNFSGGLPPSLIGNHTHAVNTGLKGLQIAGNSIMPVLEFLGNSIADRYPTHAEQFNQNINSQAFASANLARQTIETFRQYVVICVIQSGTHSGNQKGQSLGDSNGNVRCLRPRFASLRR